MQLTFRSNPLSTRCIHFYHNHVHEHAIAMDDHHTSDRHGYGSNGKVCLSLLGTWTGNGQERWVPGSSTLLQVMLSCQSMILGVPYPYYNEPGYGAPSDSAASREYNGALYPATLRWAMVDMMQHPPHGFEDVVILHFTAKRSEIMNEIVPQWTKECPQGVIGKALTSELNQSFDKMETLWKQARRE